MQSEAKDDDDTSTLLVEREKYNLFLAEIQNRSAFDAKVNQLIRIEFEDRIQSILVVEEKDFLSCIIDGIRISLEDTYSIEVFNHKSMKNILRQCESEAKKEFQKNYALLSTAWEEYETNLKASYKYKKNYKYAPRNEDKFSFLKNYRKHCRKTSTLAMHTCTENSNFLEVIDDDSNITHLICTECKACFFSDQILLYCSHCKTDFYSEILSPGEDVDLLPATWEKYHCSALVNDKMKCIKCREIFFFNLKSGLLNCVNPKCHFEAKPLSITWNCAMCRSEFKSEAKIFNPMEFNSIKKAIRQALQQKLKARPALVPCCKINVYTRIFYHKKECKGILLQGEYNNHLIVVCEKCHAMNFYDKYVWTCPVCNVRFKHLVNEEEEQEDPRKVTRTGAILDEEKNDHGIAEDRSEQVLRSSTPFYPKAKQFTDADQSVQGKKSNESKNQLIKIQSEVNYPSNKEGGLNDEPYQLEKGSSVPIKSKAKPKTLLEILEQRKSDKQSSRTQSLSDKEELLLKEKNEKCPAKYISEKPHTSKEADLLDEEDSKNQRSGNPRINTEENTQAKSEVRIEVVQEKRKASAIKAKEPEEKIKSTGHSPIITKVDTTTDVKTEDDEAVPQTSDELTQEQIDSLYKSFHTKKINEFNLDEYTVIKLIGEGSYGKIYHIQNIKNSGQYALKKLVAHNLDEVEYFKQEFELVNTMKHLYVMKIFGMTIKVLDLTTYAVYILMELATHDWDKEIKSRLNSKKPYTEKELLNIVKQLTSALAFLQKHSVSHRDLKPQNVLVFEGGIYKLADFGEAKEVKISKQLNTLRGTDIYMSPILFEGLKKNLDDVTHNSYKSDVFSLGFCLLYAATLNFNGIYEIRDLRDKNNISTILTKYLKNRYTSTFINLLIKMLDVDEQTRCDFITLEKYLREIC